ncbi:MAG TPA: MMPL family transporter [Tepidisphaeraceae bacterium]|jgi:hypothetical protein
MSRDPHVREGEAPAEPNSTGEKTVPVPVSGITRVVLWPIAHPWAMLALAAICALLAGWSITRLRANGSLTAMFPEHDPAAEALVHVLDDFPAADQLIVLASLPDGTPGPAPDRLIDFGRRFTEAVQQSPPLQTLTDGVFYMPDADSRAFVEKVIGPAAIFYLDDAAFDAARQRLSPEGMRQQLAQDQSILAAPGLAPLKELVRRDPLRLYQFITDRLTAQQPFHTFENREAFVSPDGRSLLIRVIGRESASNLDYSRTLTAAVMRAAARANTDGLKLEFTGSYPIAARSEQAIRRDMIGTVIGSVVLLQILFLLAYRSPFKLFALAFGPVALGIVLGFGIDAWVSQGLTPLTAVLGAILAGMGIDYSIQYLSYYENRRTGGSTPRRAAEHTGADMSGAVLAAWATSVVGFVAIGCSTVRALRDFAMIGTLGLTGAFLCAVFLLPAILMLTDRRATPAPRSRVRFGAAALLGGLGRHRRLWLALSLLAALGSAVVIARSGGDVLPLESDLSVMHPRPSPAIEAQYHVAQQFGVSPSTLAVYLRADTPQQLVSLAYEVNARLKTAPVVTGTLGLATLLPDPAVAERRLASLSDAEADRVERDFRAALADAGFSADAYEDYAKFLHLLLSRRDVPGIPDLLRFRRLAETILPASVSGNDRPNLSPSPGTPGEGRGGGQTGDGQSGVDRANPLPNPPPEYRGRGIRAGDAKDDAFMPKEAITLVFVRNPLDRDRASRDEAIGQVRAALRGVDGATVTGLGVVAHDAEQTVRTELPRLILAAILIVAVYLAIHFRNPADALLSLVPALFGMLVAAAALRLMGQRLNMVNLVAVPLLIGIDVDYGIFLVTLSRVKRVRMQDRDELRRHISPATHAVIVCATATLLGYISLIWTSVPAEQSLGVAASVGIAACLAGVLFLLVPILFSLARRS